MTARARLIWIDIEFCAEMRAVAVFPHGLGAVLASLRPTRSQQLQTARIFRLKSPLNYMI
ncbi:MAG TPA: hypothetical protein DDW95_11315 [Alphaproteobacteria bacterium]|nr:hypothetical protein [Alphaproteobacteria bacterium]HBC54622.1 hypothetical protein [Alphaproteobacteria bacterium]HBF99130.1 hypothetical protein [Alphaproteobacteria bacterium]HCO89505.1 hypothetical protein [Alphaproteobacteria bacterium]